VQFNDGFLKISPIPQTANGKFGKFLEILLAIPALISRCYVTINDILPRRNDVRLENSDARY